MTNKLLGIVIGSYSVKITCVTREKPEAVYTEPLPDGAVLDGKILYWDALAEFLRNMLKEHKISCRKAVFAVDQRVLYCRRVKLPLMTVKQLELNLPFEFHDYISDDMARYHFDYAVLERNEKQLDILAFAVETELVSRFTRMAKLAGLRLVGLVPTVVGIGQLIEQGESLREAKASGTPGDYAVLDLGYGQLRLHFYKGGVYEITTSLDPGCREIVRQIAEITGNDEHSSVISAENNPDNLLEDPRLQSVYDNIAVQIMRVLNFYSFNNAQNTIDTLYYMGGGARYSALVETIRQRITLPLEPFSSLVPGLEGELQQQILFSPAGYGITLKL